MANRRLQSNARPILQAIGPQAVDPWGFDGPVLRSKLLPPRGSDSTLVRQRVAALTASAEHPVTLAVAPPGFGKTTAAALWAADDAGWLTIDAADADFARFWAHFRAAVETGLPGCGELADRAIATLRLPSARDLGRALACELLEAEAPVRLVLDDLHEAGEGDLTAFLGGLLESPPPNLQLFITTRAEPGFPLGKLRLRGQLAELRGDDLLFTAGEVGDLLALVHGAPASGKRGADIFERTGGWAAGVRLAVQAGSLDTPAPAPDAAAAVAETRLIASLLDESLRDLAAAERRALLCAALLDRFRGDILAGMLPGQSPAIDAALAFARSADLCRPSATGGSGWWEFHAVYRSALRESLASSVSTGELENLHRSAAAALAAAGLPGAEIAHRLAAGDLLDAVAIVERQIPATLDREDWPELAAWLAALPEDVVESRPRLLLARGWIAHLRGRRLMLREILRRAETLLERESPGDPAARALAGELSVLRMSGASPAQADPTSSIALCELALDLMPPEWRYARGFAQAHLGHAMACAGDLAGAEALLKHQWTTGGDWPDVGSVRGLLALVAVNLQRGDIPGAEVHAAALRDLSSRGNLRLTLGWARYNLALCAWFRGAVDEAIAVTGEVAADHAHANLVCLREALFIRAISAQLAGDPDEARQSLEWSKDRLVASGAGEHLETVAAHSAWLSLLQGDAQAAASWALGANTALGWTPLQAAVHPLIVQAAALCAIGGEDHLRHALEVLAPLQERARRLGFVISAAQSASIEAIARMKLGEPPLELDTAAVPEIWRRQLVAMWPDESARLFGEPVAEQPDCAGAGPHPVLSRREREIIEFLRLGLSYSEIADRCFISPHTVKRHVASIYRKLGVGNRREAMAAVVRIGA